jgi:hypothetical protein
MTVANESNRTSAVGTAAVGQEVAFLFPINATSEIVVKTRVTATGVEATLVESTNYTVTISGDVGGTVTMVTAVAATSEIHVSRDTPMTQSLDLASGGTFSAENVEEAFDKNCRMLIDNADGVSRSLRAPSTDSSSLDMTLPSAIDRASNYLLFTATGEPTVSATVAPTTATITAFAETILDDTTQAAVQTTLGLVPGTNVQVYDADLLAIGALAKTDSNLIVGNGTTWVAESGATLRTSIGTLAETEACRVDASHPFTGTGVGFRDEDDMLSNDATAPASQQSIRAFLYSIVTYGGDVLTHDGEVLTYV